MKNKLYILIVIPFLILTGCSKSNSDEKWDKIKNKSDFSLFFQYAISTDNDKKLETCIDSLKKYMPKEPFKILRYYNYYSSYSDSNYYSNFFVEYQGYNEVDYCYRDILKIEINVNDSVRTIYLGKEIEDFSKSIISLFDTSSISENLPRYYYIPFENEKYIQRNLGVFIRTTMYPDTLNNKTSWNKLIEVTKEVLETVDILKNKKSLRIFNRGYSEINKREKELINELVPTFINIYFSLKEIPKPPPPPEPTKSILKND